MLEIGADIINDITAGRDPAMIPLVAASNAGYIVMHMQGTPQTMQRHPSYGDVITEIRSFLVARVRAARHAGIAQVWADPGFGFGKTTHHTYQLLAGLDALQDVGAPLLVGLSRKSMFWRECDATPLDVLPAVSAAHLWATLAGAEVLRTYDVGAARQVVR